MRCRGSGSPTGALPERTIGSVAMGDVRKTLAVVTCPVCYQHRDHWWENEPRPEIFSEHEEK